MSTGRPPGITTRGKVLKIEGKIVSFKIRSEEDAKYFEHGDIGALSFLRDGGSLDVGPVGKKPEDG